jgi:signal transduction histidine kinase/CheY-like chemotaxis protein
MKDRKSAPPTLKMRAIKGESGQQTKDLDDELQQGWLSVLVGTVAGTTHQLEDDNLIGRETHCQIWLPDEDVSREHARIQRVARGQFVISDLGSKNGLRINGKMVTEQLLHSGDIIMLGESTVLMFSRLDPNQSRLHRLQRLEAIGRLAGGVAHDYNNLLTVMVNNTHYLAQRYPDLPEDVRACHEEIQQAAEHASALSWRLLQFARSSDQTVDRVEVTPLLNQAVALSEKSFKPGVKVEAQVMGPLSVIGDPSQLCQVLMNLLINAGEAMMEQGTIHVIAKPIVVDTGWTAELPVAAGRYVAISVVDTGVGMDEYTRQRIFEPFFTTKGQDKGTGLGLATAFNIVRSHNGCITVVSRPGEGSTFRVLVPAADTMRRRTRSRPPTGDCVVDGGCVLVVDDEELVLKSTGRALQSLGYDVLLAKDGRTAAAELKANPKVRLVLLDVLMPEMDGAETFVNLRQLNPELRVLLFTGHSEADEVRLLLRSGALGLVRKPARLEDLKRAIQSALTQPPTF